MEVEDAPSLTPDTSLDASVTPSTAVLTASTSFELTPGEGVALPREVLDPPSGIVFAFPGMFLGDIRPPWLGEICEDGVRFPELSPFPSP